MRVGWQCRGCRGFTTGNPSACPDCGERNLREVWVEQEDGPDELLLELPLEDTPLPEHEEVPEESRAVAVIDLWEED